MKIDLSMPPRGDTAPQTLEQKLTDETLWRAFGNFLRARGKAAGWTVTAKIHRAGPAVWSDLRAVMTKPGRTPVQVFSISYSDTASVIVRQSDCRTFSGPNHSMVGRISDVLAMAETLGALPFDRDACAHCRARQEAPHAEG